MKTAAKTASITNIAINGSNQALITATSDVTSTAMTVSVAGTTQCSGAVNGGPYPVVSNSGGIITATLTHASCAGGADTGTLSSPITNYMNFVDESGLMISSTSGETTSNRETVCYTNGGSACTDVILRGVAVNLSQDVLNVLPGTPAVQLTALVSGASNTAVTWALPANLPTIQHVTTAGVGSSTSSSVTSAAFNIGTGMLAALAVNQTTDTTPPTAVTDTCGNTYTNWSALNRTWNAGGYLQSVWYKIGATAGTGCTATASWAGGEGLVSIRVFLEQPNGATMTADVGVAAFSDAASQSSITSGAFTTTGTNEVILAFGETDSFGIAGTGVIAAQSQSFGASSGNLNTGGIGLITNAVQTGQTATLNFTSNGTNHSVITVVSFKGAGGSSPYGTVTSGGVYTAPASNVAQLQTTLTATSAANSSISAQETLNICPTSGCFFLPGTPVGQNYTDSHGNVWTAGPAYGIGNTPNGFGCCDGQIDSSWAGSATDSLLFTYVLGSSLYQNDEHFSFLVPSGFNYKLTFNVDSQAHASGTAHYDFDAQGNVVGNDVDITAVAGGTYLPYTLTTSQPAPVGVLTFDEFIRDNLPEISSFSVVLSGVTPGAAAPPKAGLLLAKAK